MHSYMAHNGMLATVFFRLQEEKIELAQVVDSLPGGREAVLREAADRRAELESQQASMNEGTTPLGTPGIATPAPGAMTPTGSTGYGDPSEAFRRHLINLAESTSPPKGSSSTRESSPDGSDFRRRSVTKPVKTKSTLAMDALPKPQANLPVGTSLEPSHKTSPHDSSPPGTLAWSPNERVALLARNIDAMEDELKSNGANRLVWPQNVTYRHFFDYFTFPTLVYQLEYPRTNT
jgi:sterol O-acyltransferase